MLLSAIALLCCSAAHTETLGAPAKNPPVASAISPEVDAKSESGGRVSLPDVPTAKVDAQPGSETAAPSEPFLEASAKPMKHRWYESPRQRKIWYGLMAASHGGAAFDAWTTRRVISAGRGTEGDPFFQPFAHSNALYVATQVSPTVMDYLGHRMMTSNHLLLRRFWWIPQAAGTGVSLGAGVHNYRLSP